MLGSVGWQQLKGQRLSGNLHACLLGGPRLKVPDLVRELLSVITFGDNLYTLWGL